ncbi:MAG: VOC family protein [Methanobacteriota archaeon]
MPAKKKATAKARAKAKTAMKAATKAATKAPARPPKVRKGMITHTELASNDPFATKEFCEDVLGWKFASPMETPGGPYHMWRWKDTGGGIRANNPPEGPGSVPYCEFADIHEIYEKALKGGADEMLSPQQIPGGMGWIAIVRVPGGPAIGFWAPK